MFFDNVGGSILDDVLLHLAKRARVVICGAISQYQTEPDKKYGLVNTFSLIVSRATMQGFLILDYEAQFIEGLMHLRGWMKQGQLVVEMDEQEGFDNIPATLDRLFTGANMGKQIAQTVRIFPCPNAVVWSKRRSRI